MKYYVDVSSTDTVKCYKDPNFTILHREDGPAYFNPHGLQEWFLNGKRHRSDGPAITWADGCQEWYLNDIEYTNQKEYQEAGKISDEDMCAILLRYNFK